MNCVHGISLEGFCHVCNEEARGARAPTPGCEVTGKLGDMRFVWPNRVLGDYEMKSKLDNIDSRLGWTMNNLTTELEKLSRNVAGLTGAVEKLAESIPERQPSLADLSATDQMRAMALDAVRKAQKDVAGQGQVEPKKAVDSKDGCLGVSESDDVIVLEGDVGTWKRIHRGAITKEEVMRAEAYWANLTANPANAFTPGTYIWRRMLEDFARYRGLL